LSSFSASLRLCARIFLFFFLSASPPRPSEAFRKQMDYYSHTKNVHSLMARLAAAKPTTLVCMQGSAWQGDGARLLIALAESLDA